MIFIASFMGLIYILVDFSVKPQEKVTKYDFIAPVVCSCLYVGCLFQTLLETGILLKYILCFLTLWATILNVCKNYGNIYAGQITVILFYTTFILGVFNMLVNIAFK